MDKLFGQALSLTLAQIDVWEKVKVNKTVFSILALSTIFQENLKDVF